MPCDVTEEDSVEAAVAATVAEFGGIDILVANAGVLWLGPIESTPLKRWQLCLDVNLTGVFLVTKAVIPHVRARGGGSLIAITTTGVTMAGSNAYWVSKAGVERLYTGLAADLKPDNIAVNCLSPSRVVLTEGWQAGGAGMEIPEEMIEPPEAMANAAVLLAQQDAGGITGTIQRSEDLTVQGKWPRRVRRPVRPIDGRPAPAARRPPASPGTAGGRGRGSDPTVRGARSSGCPRTRCCPAPT